VHEEHWISSDESWRTGRWWWSLGAGIGLALGAWVALSGSERNDDAPALPRLAEAEEPPAHPASEPPAPPAPHVEAGTD
jgi:hypothetical protein